MQGVHIQERESGRDWSMAIDKAIEALAEALRHCVSLGIRKAKERKATRLVSEAMSELLLPRPDIYAAKAKLLEARALLPEWPSANLLKTEETLEKVKLSDKDLADVKWHLTGVNMQLITVLGELEDIDETADLQGDDEEEGRQEEASA
jgi:hypothetical protein